MNYRGCVRATPSSLPSPARQQKGITLQLSKSACPNRRKSCSSPQNRTTHRPESAFRALMRINCLVDRRQCRRPGEGENENQESEMRQAQRRILFVGIIGLLIVVGAILQARAAGGPE